MTIQENIEQRRFFREVLEVLEQQKHQLKARFWELLLNECKARLALPPETSKIQPYNDSQAREFERTMFTYGILKGKTVMEAPTSYLLWLAEGDDFIKSLRRYVMSDYFKRIQEREEETNAND